jgi:murein DD-endopeptidase MepM/ murein hydrolase activator NlpD
MYGSKGAVSIIPRVEKRDASGYRNIQRFFGASHRYFNNRVACVQNLCRHAVNFISENKRRGLRTAPRLIRDRILVLFDGNNRNSFLLKFRDQGKRGGVRLPRDRFFGDARGGGTRTHEGLDIMAPGGTPVVSPTDAVVLATGDGPDSGLFVRTANPGGEQFVYMHLREIAKSILTGATAHHLTEHLRRVKR